MNRPFPTLLLLFGLLAGVFAPILASAAPDDEEVAADAAGQGAAHANVQAFMAPENFDRWVFQTAGNAGDARQHLNSQLKLQLEELVRSCNLASSQQDKLLLAAAVDTKRFFEEVEVVRNRFLAMKNDQQAFQQIWQEISPLQQKATSGLYGEQSFFAKSLRAMLDAEQEAKRREVVAERMRFRFRATVESLLVAQDEQLGLTDEQHEALCKLILTEIAPPKVSGAYDSLFVLTQLSKLSEKKIAPLLNERQWKLLKKQLAKYQGMEQFLIQQGVIEK